MNHVEPLLLRVEEVATQLGLCRAKVYDLIGSNEIRSVKIGRSRRIRSTDLAAYVEQLSDDRPQDAGRLDWEQTGGGRRSG